MTRHEPVCRRCGEPFHSAIGGQVPPPEPIGPEEALRIAWVAIRAFKDGECDMVGPDAASVTHQLYRACGIARFALGEE